MHLPLFFTH